MAHKAVKDNKRCAWCGHHERDEFPLIPLGLENPFWVHYQCIEKYVVAKKAQATEEDRQERPYMYPTSKWK